MRQSSLRAIKFGALQLKFLRDKLKPREQMAHFLEIVREVLKFLELPVQVI